MRHYFFSFALCLICCFSAAAQKTILSEKAEISMLSCASGTELYALFGHTAIRISDVENHLDEVYNFGAFDFGTPHFYLKFIKGDLQYFVTTATYQDFLEEYMSLDRSVYEQQLNLTAVQKQSVFDRLQEILNSEERFYTYKFIDRNCTNMAAGIIEQAIGKPMSLDIPDKGRTNRAILYGYIQDHFYENLGISIMFGAKTDEEIYKVYLPMQLLESLQKTYNGNLPLARFTQTVVEAKPPSAGFSWWNNVYTYVLFLLAMALVRNRTVHFTYLTVLGLLGIVISFVGFYSFHPELRQNYNVLLFNPLLLFWMYFELKGKTRTARMLSWSCLGMLALYLLCMVNKPHLLLMLPIMAVNGMLIARYGLGKFAGKKK